MNLSLKSPLGIVITTLVGAFLGVLLGFGGYHEPIRGVIIGAILIWALIWLIHLATEYARRLGILPKGPD